MIFRFPESIIFAFVLQFLFINVKNYCLDKLFFTVSAVRFRNQKKKKKLTTTY